MLRPLDPPLQSPRYALRSCASLILILLLAGTSGAQSPEAEGEAYTNVREARELARRLGTRAQLRAFRERAEAFLERYPSSSRGGIVRLWLGDLLKEEDPRRALAYYRASDWPDAERRARDLAFQFEPPPALEVERWIGEPARPDGAVTFLFFFSISHPQTLTLLGRIEQILDKLGPRGLRPIGVAAVVDDRRNQTPDQIEAWVKARRLPYPVAIDRQQPDAASVSLKLYRGNRLPWGAFLDRYGRVAWIGPVALEGNALRQCDGKLRALLAEPGYGTLERRAGQGDAEAIRALGAVKTSRSASALFAARKSGLGADARKLVDAALRGMLPEGFGPDDGERWAKERDAFRYSFESDRLVRAGRGG